MSNLGSIQNIYLQSGGSSVKGKDFLIPAFVEMYEITPAAKLTVYTADAVADKLSENPNPAVTL